MKDATATAGLYEAVMGGARPRVGTPPFAPPMTQHTGGANTPTTPETLPVKHGIAGFFDRLLNPNNSLGQFGQALIASGSGPFAGAMAHMIQQRALAGKRDQQFEDWKRQYDYELGHQAPKAPTGFDAELAANGILPGTPEYAKLHKQHLDNELDPMVNISVPDVGTYFGPRSGIPGALGMPAAAAPAGGVAEPSNLGTGEKPDWSKLTGGASGNPARPFRVLG